MWDLKDVADQELLWARPRDVKGLYELRAEEDKALVGMLQWQRERGSRADATIADKRWAFQHEGFWSVQGTIHAAGNGGVTATFEPNWRWSAGTLTLSPDRRLRWRAENVGKTQWNWQEADGRPLVHIGFRPSVHEGRVSIQPAAASLPELPLLVPLGWYLLELRAQGRAFTILDTVAVIAGAASFGFG